MDKHFMVGKTINEIKLASDQKAILFVCEDGEHVAKSDGDCCSNSWIENVELPALGFPYRVNGATDLDMPDDQPDGDYGDVTAFYGLKLSTDKGDIVIDYRNSSNGYYGGNLSWPDDGLFYGGVFGQNISTEEWQPLSPTQGTR